MIGAGASGTEIASAYARLGTEVTLLEALPQILPLEDKDAARTAAREIAKSGVTIVTGAEITAVEVESAGVKITHGEGAPDTSSTWRSQPVAEPTWRASV